MCRWTTVTGWLVMVVVLTLVVNVVVPLSAVAGPSTLRGTVRDLSGGPVAWADIELWVVDDPELDVVGTSPSGTSSGDDGGYTLDLPGDLDLEAAGAHLRLEVRPPVARAGELPPFAVTVDRAELTGPRDLDFPDPSLIIEVQTPADAPVDRVLVSATTEDGVDSGEQWLLGTSSSTDADGRVALRLQAPASNTRTFTITARPPSREDRLRATQVDIEVGTDGAPSVGGAPVDGVLVLQFREPNLAVVVVGPDGQPRPDRPVSLEEWTTLDGGVQRWWPVSNVGGTTDADGRAGVFVEVTGGEQRQLRVVAVPDEDAGLTAARFAFDLTSDGALLDTSGEALDTELTLRFQRPNLTVEVVDAHGAPVVGERVRLEEFTDADPDELLPWQEPIDPYLPHVGSLLPVTDDEGRMQIFLAAEVTYPQRRLRLALDDAPPIAHGLRVTTDGEIEHDPAVETEAVTESHVRFALPVRYAADGEQTPVWLDDVNEHRAWAGLPAMRERLDWSAAAREHARYSVTNHWFAHGQRPELPLASLAGEWAAQRGNLARSFGELTPGATIRMWLNSPGHASSILSQRASEIGYGSVYRAAQGPYSYSAVLPIIDPAGNETLETVRYPAEGHTFPVPDLPPAPCFHDQGIAERVCTLHLVDERVRAAWSAGGSPLNFEAEISVGDRTIAADPAVFGIRGHLGLRLAEALPAASSVHVRVLLDGEQFAAWSFDTVGRAPEPVYTDGPTFGPPGDVDADAPGGQVPDDIAGTAHESAILELMALGIASGFGDGTFRPGDPVTRAQMASFLTRAFDLDSGAAAADFDDVDPRDVHADAIGRLARAEVTEGCAPRLYCPGDPVTRAQMASFLTRALGLEPPDEPVGFDDVAPGSTHAGTIGALAHAQVTAGCAQARFCPTEAVSRGQMATFIFRALGR